MGKDQYRAKDAFVVEAAILIRALNFDQNHFKEVRDVVRELPNKNEDELNEVTLNNLALVTMEDNYSGSFVKFIFFEMSQCH